MLLIPSMFRLQIQTRYRYVCLTSLSFYHAGLKEVLRGSSARSINVFLSLLFLLLLLVFSPSLSLVSLFFVSVALLLVPRGKKSLEWRVLA